MRGKCWVVGKAYLVVSVEVAVVRLLWCDGGEGKAYIFVSMDEIKLFWCRGDVIRLFKECNGKRYLVDELLEEESYFEEGNLDSLAVKEAKSRLLF